MGIIDERIKYAPFRERIVSAEQAAQLVRDGMTVAIPDFGSYTNPMAIVDAITRRVRDGGETLRLGLIKTANANERLEQDWCRYGILKRRMIFFGSPAVRRLVNTPGGIEFQDPHLSAVPDMLRHGQLGKLDVAIVSCGGVTEEGKLLPLFDQGYTPVALECAEQVLLEISPHFPTGLYKLHDVYRRGPVGGRRAPINVTHVMDRVGEPFYSVDPDRVKGVVISDTPLETGPMWNVAAPSPEIEAIARHFIAFLDNEVREGRLPEPLPPVQTGAGAIADAVFERMGERFDGMSMFTEGFMPGAARLLKSGRVKYISSGGLSIDAAFAADILENIDEYAQKLILRPAEVCNSPEVISRLGVIAMNNILEADIYGNVNSTNVMGTRMVSGIGGSGDFARNALLTAFFTLSTARGGAVSSIVPMCPHVDHTEHDVDVIVTEYGVADLRNRSPRQRAREMIRISHPDYRPLLEDYFERASAQCADGEGHTPHLLSEALSWHERCRRTGTMRPT